MQLFDCQNPAEKASAKKAATSLVWCGNLSAERSFYVQPGATQRSFSWAWRGASSQFCIAYHGIYSHLTFASITDFADFLSVAKHIWPVVTAGVEKEACTVAQCCSYKPEFWLGKCPGLISLLHGTCFTLLGHLLSLNLICSMVIVTLTYSTGLYGLCEVLWAPESSVQLPGIITAWAKVLISKTTSIFLRNYCQFPLHRTGEESSVIK